MPACCASLTPVFNAVTRPRLSPNAELLLRVRASCRPWIQQSGSTLTSTPVTPPR